MAFIFFMIIDHYTNDPGRILCKKDPRHTGNVFSLFEKSLDLFYRHV